MSTELSDNTKLLADKSKEYQRLRVTFTIEALSPVHVGSGLSETFKERRLHIVGRRDQDLPPKERAHDFDDASDYDCVCRDAKGRAYLPATSLRGLLRRLATQGLPHWSQTWFGPDAAATGAHVAGTLTVADAHQRDEQSLGSTDDLPAYATRFGTCVAHNVSIDCITGTAADHLLFAYEYVPVATVFDATIQVGPSTPQDLAALLGLINMIDGTPHAAIGSGRSAGMGLIKAGNVRVEVVTTAGIAKWLTSPGQSLWTKLNSLPNARKAEASKPIPAIVMRMQFASAFLVHDPGLVARKVTTETNQKGKLKYPDLESARRARKVTGGLRVEPFIPATSLRGLLRHRAARIARTIEWAGQAQSRADDSPRSAKLIDRIFGCVDQRSPLRIADGVLAPVDVPVAISTSGLRLQRHNAVDRFTGGVADSKLYTVNAAAPEAKSGGVRPVDAELSLDVDSLGALANPARGLLALVARDALEGDLALGWGKSKGYGRFKAGFVWPSAPAGVISDWSTLLSVLGGAATVQAWVHALHEYLTSVDFDEAGQG